jgi:hypothetical protein
MFLGTHHPDITRRLAEFREVCDPANLLKFLNVARGELLYTGNRIWAWWDHLRIDVVCMVQKKESLP